GYIFRWATNGEVRDWWLKNPAVAGLGAIIHLMPYGMVVLHIASLFTMMSLPSVVSYCAMADCRKRKTATRRWPLFFCMPALYVLRQASDQAR
ncbi:hypothetical protein, partial [Pseudoalteromonas sp. SIMBA_162]|uniref:hypothetical protein n=1 Tax=Pseudoalteromonas sp. SIMBA_162 TaxID=3080867 RepID=UPI00397C44AD